jgi:RimJ/RimL family protein N-acetyltransferase
LLAWLAAEPRTKGTGRIDLTADTANAAARHLYASMGGERRHLLMCRWAGEALESLRAREHQGP